jgi:hypothetical protein
MATPPPTTLSSCIVLRRPASAIPTQHIVSLIRGHSKRTPAARCNTIDRILDKEIFKKLDQCLDELVDE